MRKHCILIALLGVLVSTAPVLLQGNDELDNLARSLAAIAKGVELKELGGTNTIPLDDKGNFVIKAFLLLHPITTLVRENVKEFGNTSTVSRLSFKNAAAVLENALILFDLDSRDFLKEALDYNVGLLPENDTTGEVQFFKEQVEKLKGIIDTTKLGSEEERKNAAVKFFASLTPDLMINKVLWPLFGIFVMGKMTVELTPLYKEAIVKFFVSDDEKDLNKPVDPKHPEDPLAPLMKRAAKKVAAATDGFEVLLKNLHLTKAVVEKEGVFKQFASFFSEISGSWKAHQADKTKYSKGETVSTKLTALADILYGVGQGKVVGPVINVSFKSAEDDEKEKKEIEDEKKKLKEQLEKERLEKEKVEKLEKELKEKQTKECRKRVVLRVLRDVYDSLFVNALSELSPDYWENLLQPIIKGETVVEITGKGGSHTFDFYSANKVVGVQSTIPFPAGINEIYTYDEVAEGIKNSRIAANFVYHLMAQIAIEQKWLGDLFTESEFNDAVGLKRLEDEYHNYIYAINVKHKILKTDNAYDKIWKAFTEPISVQNTWPKELVSRLSMLIKRRYFYDFLFYLCDELVSEKTKNLMDPDWTRYVYDWYSLTGGEHTVYVATKMPVCKELEKQNHLIEYFAYLNTILCGLLKDVDDRITAMAMLGEVYIYYEKHYMEQGHDFGSVPTKMATVLKKAEKIAQNGCLADWQNEARAMQKAIKDVYAALVIVSAKYKFKSMEMEKLEKAVKDLGDTNLRNISLSFVESQRDEFDKIVDEGLKYLLELIIGYPFAFEMLRTFNTIPADKDWTIYEYNVTQNKWVPKTGVEGDSAFVGFKYLGAYFKMVEKLWDLCKLPLVRTTGNPVEFLALIPK
ncbi:TPA: hypothetical protein DDZ86_03510 [Candidatus Dependentiae bacterium]|nr:MAG: SAP DNA-binding domain-containing protein [candidate division TM6 bacterium GW2011_GWF2_43_87]HBL98683.1 hypothetical protein [Candidatus Dependentiae bacterium]